VTIPLGNLQNPSSELTANTVFSLSLILGTKASEEVLRQNGTFTSTVAPVSIVNAGSRISQADSKTLENSENVTLQLFNPLTPELNPSVQRRLTRFFTWDFAS
jgi:hypothetical protein